MAVICNLRKVIGLRGKHGLIELKVYRDLTNSLILNINSGDWIRITFDAHFGPREQQQRIGHI